MDPSVNLDLMVTEVCRDTLVLEVPLETLDLKALREDSVMWALKERPEDLGRVETVNKEIEECQVHSQEKPFYL